MKRGDEMAYDYVKDFLQWVAPKLRAGRISRLPHQIIWQCLQYGWVRVKINEAYPNIDEFDWEYELTEAGMRAVGLPTPDSSPAAEDEGAGSLEATIVQVLETIGEGTVTDIRNHLLETDHNFTTIEAKIHEMNRAGKLGWQNDKWLNKVYFLSVKEQQQPPAPVADTSDSRLYFVQRSVQYNGDTEYGIVNTYTNKVVKKTRSREYTDYVIEAWNSGATALSEEMFFAEQPAAAPVADVPAGEYTADLDSDIRPLILRSNGSRVNYRDGFNLILADVDVTKLVKILNAETAALRAELAAAHETTRGIIASRNLAIEDMRTMQAAIHAAYDALIAYMAINGDTQDLHRVKDALAPHADTDAEGDSGAGD